MISKEIQIFLFHSVSSMQLSSQNNDWKRISNLARCINAWAIFVAINGKSNILSTLSLKMHRNINNFSNNNEMANFYLVKVGSKSIAEMVFIFLKKSFELHQLLLLEFNILCLPWVVCLSQLPQWLHANNQDREFFCISFQAFLRFVLLSYYQYFF